MAAPLESGGPSGLESSLAGLWKRWFRRHVNAFSFWCVLALVALALVAAAWVVAPRPEEPAQGQPPAPGASSR